MKRGNRQTIFLATAICLTLLTLFVLRFEITGNVVANNNWCDGYDINRDGKVDSNDLQKITELNNKYPGMLCNDANKIVGGTYEECKRGDLNKDSLISYKDYNLLKGVYIGIAKGDYPQYLNCGDGTVAKTADGKNCMVDTTKCIAGPTGVSYGVINNIIINNDPQCDYDSCKVCVIDGKNYKFIQPTNSCTKVNEIVPTTDGKCYSYNERTMCIPQGKVCDNMEGGNCILAYTPNCREYEDYVVVIGKNERGTLTFYPNTCYTTNGKTQLKVMGCKEVVGQGFYETIKEFITPKTDEICNPNAKSVKVENNNIINIASIVKQTIPTPQTICGTANGKTLTTAPSTTIELCTSPATKYDPVATTTSGWSWNCIDSAGKFTTCSATKTTTPITTTCTKNNGDLNRDTKVNDSDLNLLNAQWGGTCTSPTWCECADINQDGKVGLGDQALLSSLYTTTTPKTYCGDGKIQSPNDERVYEQCDGSVSGLTCQIWGYDGGIPQCVNCQINFDKCTQTTRVATPINYCNPLTNSQFLTTQPITNLCSGDNNYVSVPVTANSTGWTWTCKSPNPPEYSSTCSAIKTTTPITTTICGTANGKTLITAPSTTIELCTSPATKYGSIETNSTSWIWKCMNSGSGVLTTCSATKTTTPITTTCTGIGYTCGPQKTTKQQSCNSIGRLYLENQTLDETCGNAMLTGCCGDCLYGFNDAGGDCYDLPQKCSKLRGTICASNQECSGENWMTSSDSERCCKTTCTTPTPSEISSRRGISKQTYKPTATALRTGYSPEKPLKKGDKIEFSIGSTKHTLEIISLSTSAARIKISSNIIEEVISKGQTRKFELTGDHYYDLKIELKDITINGAKIILTTINELKTSQEQTSQKTYKRQATTVYKDETGEDLEEGLLPLWVYIVAALVILISFVMILLLIAHKRKQRYEGSY